jgi:hypothetical protein
VCCVNGLAFPRVKSRWIGVHPADIEGLDHLDNGENVAILRDCPAEQRQIVQQSFRQISLLLVFGQTGSFVPLG